MERTVQIQAPLPHIRSVNIWVLCGEPLTLIDTGPRSDQALTALEAGLRTGRPARRGHRARDPHPPPSRPHGPDRHDRGSLRAPAWRPSIAPPSTARTTSSAPTADRSFSRELMRHHGVPESVIEANEGFWDYIRDTSEAYRDRRRPVRRRCDRRGRARSPDPGSPGPQHDRRAAGRRGEQYVVVGGGGGTTHRCQDVGFPTRIRQPTSSAMFL